MPTLLIYLLAPSRICSRLFRPGKTEARVPERENLAKRMICREFPWMGTCVSTWDSVVDTVMRELGGEGFDPSTPQTECKV